MQRTEQEKAELLKAHKKSGVSKLAFCKANGICYASFLTWEKQAEHAGALHTGFVQIASTLFSAGTDSGTGIRILFEGIEIQVEENFHSDTFVKVLEALRNVKL